MAKKPTHILKAMTRTEHPGVPAGRGNRVGVGWLNDDGSLSLHLDVGVSLSWADGLQLTAFPRSPPACDDDDDAGARKRST